MYCCLYVQACCAASNAVHNKLLSRLSQVKRKIQAEAQMLQGTDDKLAFQHYIHQPQHDFEDHEYECPSAMHFQRHHPVCGCTDVAVPKITLN